MPRENQSRHPRGTMNTFPSYHGEQITFRVATWGAEHPALPRPTGSNSHSFHAAAGRKHDIPCCHRGNGKPFRIAKGKPFHASAPQGTITIYNEHLSILPRHAGKPQHSMSPWRAEHPALPRTTGSNEHSFHATTGRGHNIACCHGDNGNIPHCQRKTNPGVHGEQ